MGSSPAKRERRVSLGGGEREQSKERTRGGDNDLLLGLVSTSLGDVLDLCRRESRLARSSVEVRSEVIAEAYSVDDVHALKDGPEDLHKEEISETSPLRT